MIDFLRPAPEVIAFLFLKTYIVFPALLGIGIIAIRRTTQHARTIAILCTVMALFGILATSAPVFVPKLASVASAVRGIISPWDGVIWAGGTAVTGLIALGLSKASHPILIALFLGVFIVYLGSWMIAY